MMTVYTWKLPSYLGNLLDYMLLGYAARGNS